MVWSVGILWLAREGCKSCPLVGGGLKNRASSADPIIGRDGARVMQMLLVWGPLLSELLVAELELERREGRSGSSSQAWPGASPLCCPSSWDFKHLQQQIPTQAPPTTNATNTDPTRRNGRYTGTENVRVTLANHSFLGYSRLYSVLHSLRHACTREQARVVLLSTRAAPRRLETGNCYGSLIWKSLKYRGSDQSVL